MVFCNNEVINMIFGGEVSHNPYFNRWFSAMLSGYMAPTGLNSHNPYFNRWFSAIP